MGGQTPNPKPRVEQGYEVDSTVVIWVGSVRHDLKALIFLAWHIVGGPPAPPCHRGIIGI